jgi:hypothetical protein
MCRDGLAAHVMLCPLDAGVLSVSTVSTPVSFLRLFVTESSA